MSRVASSFALTADDRAHLIPTFVATSEDVDLAERANISVASLWAFGRRRVATPDRLLTEAFGDTIHRRMFGDVWAWAGAHRAHRLQDGVAPRDIEPELRKAFTQARRRHDDLVQTPRARALRLHDSLVSIRPYPGGNLRHARFMADLYLHLLGEPRIDWLKHRPTKRTATALTELQKALDRAVTPTDPKQLKSALDDALKSRR